MAVAGAASHARATPDPPDPADQTIAFTPIALYRLRE